MVISSYTWLSVVISGYQWLSMVIHGNERLYMSSCNFLTVVCSVFFYCIMTLSCNFVILYLVTSFHCIARYMMRKNDFASCITRQMLTPLWGRA